MRVTLRDLYQAGYHLYIEVIFSQPPQCTLETSNPLMYRVRSKADHRTLVLLHFGKFSLRPTMTSPYQRGSQIIGGYRVLSSAPKWIRRELRANDRHGSHKATQPNYLGRH